MSKPWFVLRCLPQKEVETEKLIRRMGYDAMVPYLDGQRRVHGRSRPWRFPLFQGYAFASWEDWSDGWNRVTDKIKWVYDFIGPSWTNKPSVLRPADVDYIQSIADGKYRSGEPTKGIRVGDWVLVSDGSFQGCTVLVKEIVGKKATVEVPQVKITSNVKIPLAKLEKCE